MAIDTKQTALHYNRYGCPSFTDGIDMLYKQWAGLYYLTYLPLLAPQLQLELIPPYGTGSL